MIDPIDEYFYSGVLAVVGAFLSWFIGEANGVLKVLLIMVIIDYITGIMKGIVTRTLSSKESANGIFIKITIFMIVGIANVIDKELLGATDFMRDAACFFYISTEGISILENAIAIDLPIPDALKDRFLEWRDGGARKLEASEQAPDTETHETL